MSDALKENLQQFLDELEGEEAAQKKADSKPDLKLVEGGAGADMEQTLEGLKEESPPDSILDHELEKEIDQELDNHRPSATVSPGAAGDGTLSMKLQGNMKLELSYAQGTQTVTVRFEQDCLFVNLDNGAEFKIPVR